MPYFRKCAAVPEGSMIIHAGEVTVLFLQLELQMRRAADCLARLSYYCAARWASRRQESKAGASSLSLRCTGVCNWVINFHDAAMQRGTRRELVNELR